ncbi:MAG: M56 family metallopeptidase [Gemmatimonadota bacterium]|nr:M56 family metallopeptidase [Gemmatimonadota bacterium]
MTPLALDVALKGVVVLLATALASYCLRHRSAGVRHLVWAVGLASLAALPALAGALPHWRLEILPAESTAAVAGAGSTSGTAGWAVWAWLAGAVAAGGIVLLGRFRVWWLARTSAPVTDPDWLALAADVRAWIGLDREVDLRSSDRVPVPMMWGVIRPVVLLPEEAGTWPERLRRDVLLHELVHVKRHDYATQLLGRLACATHWFNPLAWIAVRRLRLERERACDDHVLAVGANACDYAESLLEMARAMNRGAGPMHAMAMAEPSRFGERLAALLDSRHRRGIVTRAAVLKAALVAALVVGAVATARPDHRAEPVPGTSVDDPVRAWAAGADLDGDGVVTVYRAPAIEVAVGEAITSGASAECEEKPPALEGSRLQRIASHGSGTNLH